MITETPEPTATVSGATTVCKGSPATIKVALTGSGPWNLYWTDGYQQLNVPGPTATRVVTPSTSIAYGIMTVGDVNCQAHPPAAFVIIGVNPGAAPSFRGVPSVTTVSYGRTAVLTPDLAGSGPFTAQWYEGAAHDTSHPIAGATGLTFETPPVTSLRTYWVSVSNACGATESATMSVNFAAPKRRALH